MQEPAGHLLRRVFADVELVALIRRLVVDDVVAGDAREKRMVLRAADVLLPAGRRAAEEDGDGEQDQARRSCGA
jgi:hypothetical protein